jgi:hypothetical protein
MWISDTTSTTLTSSSTSCSTVLFAMLKVLVPTPRSLFSASTTPWLAPIDHRYLAWPAPLLLDPCPTTCEPVNGCHCRGITWRATRWTMAGSRRSCQRTSWHRRARGHTLGGRQRGRLVGVRAIMVTWGRTLDGGRRCYALQEPLTHPQLLTLFGAGGWPSSLSHPH